MNFRFLFFYIFVFLNFNNFFCKIFLTVHCVKTKNKSFKKNIFVPIFYKGMYKKYPLNGIGQQINFEEDVVPKDIFLVISPDIEVIYSDTSNSIKGLKISENGKAKCYNLSLSVSYDENSGKLSYRWEIEDEDIPLSKLPADSMVIFCDPQHVDILNFDKEYSPNFPVENEDEVSGMIILPSFLIDADNILSSEQETKIQDLKFCHT